MPTKNKYQNKPQVNLWTWVAVLGFIMTLILLLIFTAPNSNRRLFNSYRDAAQGLGEPLNTQKFDRHHSFRGINQRQLLRAIDNGELIVVFMGNTNSQQSIAAIQDVNARFQGARLITSQGVETINAAQLYTDNVINRVRYLEISGEDVEALGERINEHLNEDSDEFTSINVPTLVAFMNGELVALEVNLTGEVGIRNIRNFFSDVFDHWNEITNPA